MLCKHQQDFYAYDGRAHKKVLIILLITLATMFTEVVAGYLFNSVALMADGVHMSTHVLAFAITYTAYYLAKKWSKEGSFTFGTWKVEVLGAYTSGILLFFASFLLLEEAFSKLLGGGDVEYDQALVVAFIGLGVNLLSAYLLHGEHHREDKAHGDLNLHGAFLHVLADLLTSVLAIIGLLTGKFLGLWFMDPLMALLGFVLIIRWSLGLMRESASILLDREGKNPMLERIIKTLEEDGESRVYDIHLLRVHKDKYACIVGIETTGNYDLGYYQKLISGFREIAHATIELKSCS
ncbi:MAG: CDF family Co(II)/Ni(II) efflux transporter DmeF [Aquificaceae bacterium]|nr:CDF family Co(II)/Ni(II) efflux transporter DmeF [Aquificaceae bacterium]MDW8294373.1 CDF family Co(II)/Ni(II) efflux transporter DmeF [Aquificaceae bacterium]